MFRSRQNDKNVKRGESDHEKKVAKASGWFVT